MPNSHSISRSRSASPARRPQDRCRPRTGTPSAPATRPAAQQNIVRTAAAAGQFKTLLALSKKAGLVGALRAPAR